MPRESHPAAAAVAITPVPARERTSPQAAALPLDLKLGTQLEFANDVDKDSPNFNDMCTVVGFKEDMLEVQFGVGGTRGVYAKAHFRTPQERACSDRRASQRSSKGRGDDDMFMNSGEVVGLEDSMVVDDSEDEEDEQQAQTYNWKRILGYDYTSAEVVVEWEDYEDDDGNKKEKELGKMKIEEFERDELLKSGGRHIDRQEIDKWLPSEEKVFFRIIVIVLFSGGGGFCRYVRERAGWRSKRGACQPSGRAQQARSELAKRASEASAERASEAGERSKRGAS
jgi:hypothetical protein